ncbi:MAG: HAD family hydrolase [Spirochaetia bacterium]
MKFRAVLFDFDGTLTRPEALDFGELRRLLSCPLGEPILEHIQGLPTESERQRAWEILDAFELAAARASVPNEGSEELIALLKQAGILRGILSRNSRASVLEAMKRFRSLGPSDFSVLISRESPGRPKPHPDGVELAAELFELPPSDLLMVGDFVFDIMAGKSAGAVTVFLTNGRVVPAMAVSPDFVVASLSELPPILGLQGARAGRRSP